MRPWLNQFLLRTFQRQNDRKTWKLITLTREPIGRNISAFFENLEVARCETEGDFEISSDYYQISPTVVSVNDTHKLVELFFDRARHDSPLRFFDREIRDIFGIDVLRSGFPIDTGYEIYRKDRVELLVLRLESLSRCAGQAFADFLGIDDFKTVDQNIGAKKVYAPLYDAFKRNVTIDSEYAGTLYESNYMRTFYSDAEIGEARAKWLKNAVRRTA